MTMTTTTAPTWMLLLLLGMGMLGCRNSAPEPEGGPDAPVADVPDDFLLRFGRGGGMTGQWSGYMLHADGTVQRWSGFGGEEDAEGAGHVSGDEVAAVWQRLQDDDFFEIEVEETGNMTAFIEATADGAEHRVSWVPGSDTAATASTLQDLYDYSRMVAQSATDR